MSEKGKKDDVGKPMMSCVDPNFVFGLAEALTFGAHKYGRHNWKLKGVNEYRRTDAMLRHIYKAMNGEHIDEESGLDHRILAATNIMFWLYHHPAPFSKESTNDKTQEETNSTNRRGRNSLPVRAYRAGKDLLGRIFRRRRNSPGMSTICYKSEDRGIPVKGAPGFSLFRSDSLRKFNV